jgi:uncharacterized protein YceK
MPKPRTSRSGLLLAMLLALSGCASVQPVAAECPKFVPSPEALRAMPGTDWKSPAARLIEYYTTPLQPSNAPTK